MSHRARLIAILVLVALVLGLVYTQTRSTRAPLPDRRGPAGSALHVPGTAADDPATAPRGSAAVRRTQTAEQRRARLAAIEAARDRRLGGAASVTAPGPAREVTSGAPLDMIDKTGDTSPWEKRTLGTLNALLGECVDAAQTEQPGLEGTLTVTFTLAGEPSVGGLLETVNFDGEHSSITLPSLHECVEQSLYALELDPPPDGVRVGRQVSLRVP